MRGYPGAKHSRPRSSVRGVPTLTIAPCSVAAIRSRQDLLDAHGAEAMPDLAVDPQWDTYERLEASGVAQCLAALIDGRMVGYAVFFVFAPLNHRLETVVHGQVIYVSPKARKAGLGLDLLREVAKDAKALGARGVLWRAAPGRPLASVLEGLDYRIDEITYRKDL